MALEEKGMALEKRGMARRHAKRGWGKHYYRADTISIPKISKGNNSAKNVGGVTVLISARRLIMLYICAKFREIILNGIKVIERTRMINR